MIPPVFLDCELKFDYDDETGELFSVEPAPVSEQRSCKRDALKFPEVAFALDPQAGSDWLTYFKREFVLERGFELYSGDKFIRNLDTLPTTPLPHGESASEIWSFKLTTLDDFKGRVQTCGARAGVVVVYRKAPASEQPFGMWFGWVLVGGANPTLVIIDIQNGKVAASLREMIPTLLWPVEPRDEIFWAPLKH